MLRLEEWVDIESRHAAGQSIKAIARELGVSRNTVRATLRREGPPQYERRGRPGKLVELELPRFYGQVGATQS